MFSEKISQKAKSLTPVEQPETMNDSEPSQSIVSIQNSSYASFIGKNTYKN